MFKQVMMAAAATAGIAIAADASAATFDFRSPSASGMAESLDFGLFEVRSDAAFLSVNRPSKVSYGAFGLGVSSLFDLYDADQIDGFPVGTAEWLTVTFDRAVRLASFTLGRMDGGTSTASRSTAAP